METPDLENLLAAYRPAPPSPVLRDRVLALRPADSWSFWQSAAAILLLGLILAQYGVSHRASPLPQIPEQLTSATASTGDKQLDAMLAQLHAWPYRPSEGHRQTEN